MKATLEFNLPEEKIEYNLALHGRDWQSVVAQLHMSIRAARKHGHHYADADEVLEDVWNTLHYEMMDHGLTLD
jgi:hypothetical protein